MFEPQTVIDNLNKFVKALTSTDKASTKEREDVFKKFINTSYNEKEADEIIQKLKKIIMWLEYFNNNGLRIRGYETTIDPSIPSDLVNTNILGNSVALDAAMNGDMDKMGISGTGLLSDKSASAMQYLQNAYRAKYCDGKSRPLLPQEIHIGCSNYAGPGTRIDRPSVRNYKPYNNIDACAREHDLNYEAAFKIRNPQERYKSIRSADNMVQRCFDKYPNDRYRDLAKFAIGTKMKSEDLIPYVTRPLYGNYNGE